MKSQHSALRNIELKKSSMTSLAAWMRFNRKLCRLAAIAFPFLTVLVPQRGFRRLTTLCLLLALVPAGSAPAQTPAPPPVTQQSSPRPVPPPAPKSQEQFIVYWTTEAGWNTELLLRNNLEASNLTVTPSVRTPDGLESVLPAITIAPGDVSTVDLREALSKSAPQLVGSWGSLALRYRSTVNGALYSSVMVRADSRPIAFHLDGFGRGYTYEAGSREGIWWLPRTEVTDYLILTNSGEQPLEPRLILYDASGKTREQSLTLPARQSQRLSIRALLQQSGLQGSYGGFKIDIAHGARFLDSAHLLFEQSGGFSAVMKMFRHDPRTTLASRDFANVKEWTTRAPMLALTTPDPALGLPAGTALQPMLFVRNTLAKRVTARIRFNWRSTTDSGKSAPIDLILKANETKVLNVGALQDGKMLPRDANWASVILSAPVLPDDLLAVAASYDPTGRYGAQTPFNDQLAPHWEGGKWEVDDTHNSLSTIINGGNKPVFAELTILYNQGRSQYQIQRLLAPEEQMFVDFGRLVHDQIPDKNGQTLPPDLTSGAYRVRDLTDSRLASLYEGKVIVDKTFGHVSYGCGICCGPNSPFMMYDPLPVTVGGSAYQGVEAMNSCTGRLSIITGDFPTWWTGNTSIATANGRSIGGVAVGTTDNDAQSVWMYFGPKEDAGGQPCPQDQMDANGGTNVDDFTVSNAQTITDGDQGSFGITVTPGSPSAPSSYKWSFSVPVQGAGNNPNVNFTNATAAQTGTDGHWYAFPDASCPPADEPGAPNRISPYTINASVTFQDGNNVQHTTTLNVKFIWFATGRTGQAQITGSPAMAPDGQGIWHITGMGTMTRVLPVNGVLVPQSSQFYNKSFQHEQVHVNQWNPGGLVGDLYIPADLFNQVKNFTSTSQTDLATQYSNALDAYSNAQVNIFAQRKNALELQAYQVSDPIAPQYMIQNCGRFQ